MVIFRLTKLAKQDLRSIGRYTQVTWGKDQRNLYLAKIDAVWQVATNALQAQWVEFIESAKSA